MMKKISCILLTFACMLKASAQVDTVIVNELAAHLFPSFPVKSSYTSLFDKRSGKDYVYSANMESGLGIYDISNPTIINPVLNYAITNFKGLDVSTVGQRGNSLFVGIGDFQVNTNSSSGLAIVDITNPLSPVIKDIWDSTLFKHGISHLIVEGNYAYLSTMKDGIIILDVSNENNIVFKSRLSLDLNFPAPSSNAHNARGLKYKNDTLFVCFDRGGLRMIDVSNKSNPSEVYKYINSTLNSQAAAAYNDVTIKGKYAFVSVDYCGLEVLDIGTVPFTSVQWYNPWGCNSSNWSGAALHTNEVVTGANDSLLFVSAGQSELLVFDITNPLNVKTVGAFGNLNDSLATHGLDVRNNKVILSYLHTPLHIPPFTPFYADPGGLKLVEFRHNKLPTYLNEIGMPALFLEVFPNPNAGEMLKLMCNADITEIKLFDATGRPVAAELKREDGAYTVSLLGKARGIYFLLVKTKTAELSKKIVVQ